jgi:alpha-beta hydrolase superfamily lysophospholipase
MPGGRGSVEPTSQTATPKTSPEVTPAEPPTLSDACGGLEVSGARPFWLESPDGVRLYGIEAGRGGVGVVLAHQGRSTLCGSLPYMQTLVDAGFLVLAFDFRGNGKSETPEDADARLELGRDLEAAVSRIRSNGAEKVVLIGASMGGAASVQNGADLEVDAIVSLSGTRLWPGFGVNHPDSLPRISVPFVMYVSRNDSNVPLEEAQGIVAAVGSKDKDLVVLEGSDHGYAFVQTSDNASEIRAEILDWIEARV